MNVVDGDRDGQASDLLLQFLQAVSDCPLLTFAETQTVVRSIEAGDDRRIQRRLARHGLAKGPFVGGIDALDAELGKKNRRIWIANLSAEWATTHSEWLRQVATRWPMTWPMKYRSNEYAWSDRT